MRKANDKRKERAIYLEGLCILLFECIEYPDMESERVDLAWVGMFPGQYPRAGLLKSFGLMSPGLSKHTIDKLINVVHLGGCSSPCGTTGCCGQISLQQGSTADGVLGARQPANSRTACSLCGFVLMVMLKTAGSREEVSLWIKRRLTVKRPREFR